MDLRLTENLESIRRWLDEVEAIPLPEDRPSGLSSREKQELRRVEGLIDQLKSHGVALIPAELVNKKCELVARDVPLSAPSDAVKFLPALEELCGKLGEIAKKARILRNQIRSRTANTGPPAYYDVQPLDLLKAGYLSTDDRLELWWSNSSGVFADNMNDLAYAPQCRQRALPFLRFFNAEHQLSPGDDRHDRLPGRQAIDLFRMPDLPFL